MAKAQTELVEIGRVHIVVEHDHLGDHRPGLGGEHHLADAPAQGRGLVDAGAAAPVARHGDDQPMQHASQRNPGRCRRDLGLAQFMEKLGGGGQAPCRVIFLDRFACDHDRQDRIVAMAEGGDAVHGAPVLGSSGI